jgi:hypothetical protein
MEPWDGPAMIAFTNGVWLCACQCCNICKWVPASIGYVHHLRNYARTCIFIYYCRRKQKIYAYDWLVFVFDHQCYDCIFQRLRYDCVTCGRDKGT